MRLQVIRGFDGIIYSAIVMLLFTCHPSIARNGLGNVATVTGSLRIQSNEALTQLGLDALTSLGSLLSIQDNSLMPTCDAEALRVRLVAVGWSEEVRISGNNATCP